MYSSTHSLLLLPLALLVDAGCNGTHSSAGRRNASSPPACNAAQIRHHHCHYLEDVDATIAHLKSSYMGHGGLSPTDIEDFATNAPRAEFEVSDSRAELVDFHCCIERMLADTPMELAFDARCTSRGYEKRFTFRPYQEGKFLLIIDGQPGQAINPETPGFNAIRFEEWVFVPATGATTLKHSTGD